MDGTRQASQLEVHEAMKPDSRMALVVAALTVLVAAARGQVTAAQWKSDLDVLAKELPERHKNAFAVLPKAEFSRRVSALSKKLGLLDELHSEGELVSLVAALGDSHSAVQMRALTAGPRLPLGLYWFADGVRLVAVPKAHEQVSGARLDAIGECDVAEVAKRLARVQAFDNEAATWNGIPNLVTLPNLLRYLGITGDPANVPITVTDDEGKKRTITVVPGPIGRDAVVLRPAKPPLTAGRGNVWHHYEWLEKEGLLYVQYNKCSTDAEHDLGKFTADLLLICARQPVKALVFDLQYNGGGSSPLGDEMFEKLSKEAPLKDRKNVFCVIGRRTFSSAILNAMTLKSRYGAVLVGEPSGGSPNHFGEVTSFELPNTKLKVFYSQKRFERAPPGTTTITPDHVARATFADYLAGRDVVLDLIRTLVK
jgi:hypothetical protein